MILATGNRRRTRRLASAGFTLIELVLVMTILIIVLSMSATSLSSFFKGRTIESEGSRFLALTRLAQSRAVAEGVPTSLWIDARAGKYGLEIEPGYSDTDEKAKEFELGKDLQIEVTWLTTPTLNRPNGNEVTLRFTPEGYIDESNPELITIKEKNKTGDSVFIAPNLNRLNYEITTNNVVYALRR